MQFFTKIWRCRGVTALLALIGSWNLVAVFVFIAVGIVLKMKNKSEVSFIVLSCCGWLYSLSLPLLYVIAWELPYILIGQQI